VAPLVSGVDEVRKRKLLLVLAGLAMLLCASGAFVLWPRRDRFTEEYFDRIAEYTVRSQVEAILGPPGDYTTGPMDKDPIMWGDSERTFRSSGELGGETFYKWFGDTRTIRVAFYPTGEVAYKECHGAKRIQQSPIESLIWRAERQWRRWFPE
jgi:hypothetical protein